MPKILVLFSGQPTAAVNAVADGARSVRFSEVEVRRVGPQARDTPADHHQTLTGPDEIVPYDGIIAAASTGGVLSPELGQLIADAATLAPRPAWQNKVGSAFMPEAQPTTPDVWPSLATLGNVGMLVIAPSGEGVEAARELGARVAQAVAWVTHARSHHHAH